MNPVHRVSFGLSAILVVLCCITAFNDALAAAIDLPVRFDAAQLKLVESPEGVIYSLPGTQNLRATGAPALPYASWKVVLPQGKTLMEVEVQDAHWKRLTNRGQLARATKLMSDQGTSVSVSMGGLREDFQDGGTFPSAAARGQGFAVMEGYRVATVDVFPMRVLEDGTVEILTRGQLHLVLADQAMDEVAEREVAWPGVAERAAQRVRKLVVNPEQVDFCSPPAGIAPELLKSFSNKAPSPLDQDEVFAGGRVDYVIITIPSLVSEFQRLADDHIAHGLRAKVVTTDWILDNYRHGVDLQETIRYFLKEAYAKWGLHYVLLGGDAAILPPRYVRSTFYPPGGHTDIPADLYFGALDGNWNANGNGIFGEAYQSFLDPGDYQDMVAEVVVGRAPVNDLAEATTFVDKCLEYQTPSNSSYLGKALFLSEVLFPSDWDGVSTINLDGATYSENIIFNSLITPGNLIDSERLYENYTAYPYTLQETQQAALDSMSTGHFGLVNHVGHGFYYNMSVGDKNIFAGDALSLTNAPNYFVINALNCSSGAFDFDCLLETYIQHPGGGSVASLGASREA
ncbi:MAG TPA: C25 family cysteine peptidase, partial [Candidatus Krumholzibacteria bacterium]|nr:C25 family cysteine peptidase [Candidatus Krumholzibacteria bacterium]